MMGDLFLLLFLVIMGAAIGGGTNVLAIRMLFRPLRAHYIGSFKIPFTPGLIPKRRKEIAKQLGKIVEEHLLTPEAIIEKLLQKSFLMELEKRLKQIIHQFFSEEKTITEWLHIHLEGIEFAPDLEDKIKQTIREKLIFIVDEHKDRPLGDLLSDEWLGKLEREIPHLTNILLKKGQEYFESDDGKKHIEILVHRFFETRGNVAKTIGRFVQRVSVESLVAKEIVKLFQQEETKRVINDWLKKEWSTFIKKTPAQIIKQGDMDYLLDQISQGIVAEFPLVKELEKPIYKWAQQYEEKVTNIVVPFVMNSIVNLIKEYFPPLLLQVDIRGMVRKRVDEFPVIRLEEMLLTVIKRELRAIELLGAIIGGWIGFIQGLIVIFFL